MSMQRTVPFTPKRPLSATSTSLLASTHRKYKAPLSSESKSRSTKAASVDLTKLKTDSSSSTSTSSYRPKHETPRPKSRAETSYNRPRTPGTPRADDTDNGSWERDVSRVDPEEELVDASNVDAGDISGDIDSDVLKSLSGNAAVQADDKVMVSVRLRPTSNPTAWSTTSSTIKLEPPASRTGTTTNGSNSSFTFDSILTTQNNKSIYATVALPHVHSAMSGYNAVIFAYGQTASGKTHTLSGSEDEPGIIPRAMKDVFSFIRKNDGREYLLRCSYLEIYNETIIDLLASPSMAASNPVQIQGTGDHVVLAPLREEVVTSFKGVKEVLKRGEGNRRTACTDWNERSSRSHSVFRLVIESRERGSGSISSSGRQTPGLASGRMTPGGSRLQAKGDKSVQTSVLSLIDLAGSEKATSDKDRTREGKYINTSLLTLGSVIGTLAENAAKGKSDHVPYRNSKLTRMLQPSLSGNARISVICTINPETSAITESTSTLLFARRVKGVALSAKKKEIVDTDALIERYRKEIEDLKRRLSEKEEADGQFATGKKRRLSAQEQIDESKAMKDLNARIQQLTKLILTSQTVGEESGSASRPSSPVKVDFDMSPYQLQQELLAARYQLESQANQILSLEAALVAKPAEDSSSDPSSPTTEATVEQDALLAEKDTLIADQAARIALLEDNSAVVELQSRLDEEVKKAEERDRWCKEVEKALEKERKMRIQLEEERRALAAFVSKFDALGLGGLSANSTPASSPVKPTTTAVPSAAKAPTLVFQKTTLSSSIAEEDEAQVGGSPIRMSMALPEAHAPSLLDEDWGGVYDPAVMDLSFEAEPTAAAALGLVSKAKAVLGKKQLGEKDKENLPVS